MHALCIHFKCFASFLLSFYRMLGFKLCLVGRDQFPLQQQQISCQNLERHSKQQDVCLIFPPFLYLSIFHQCECIKCEDYRIFCQNYWYEISFGLYSSCDAGPDYMSPQFSVTRWGRYWDEWISLQYFANQCGVYMRNLTQVILVCVSVQTWIVVSFAGLLALVAYTSDQI